MHHSVQPCGCTIFYFIILHLAVILFSVSSFNPAVGSSYIPQACYTINSYCSLFISSLDADNY